MRIDKCILRCLICALGMVACGGGQTQQVRTGQDMKGFKAESGKKVDTEDLTMRKVEAPKEPEFVEGVNKEAQIAFRKGVIAVSKIPPDYNTALSAFEEAINRDKAFLEAYFNLGMTYERMGKPDDAMRVYQRAVDANPGNLDAQGYVGKVYLSLAKRAKDSGDQIKASTYESEAKRIFDQIIAKDPDNITANNALALYWLYRGDPKTAEDFVKKVLLMEPRNVVALNTRGLINLMAGKNSIARWVFEEKALREDPNSTEAWTNLGLTYLKQGKTPEAVQAFEKAIAADRDNIEARLNAAAIYLEYLHYQAALDQYNEVLRLVPNNVEALIGSGSALLGLHKPNDAIERYEKALKIDPSKHILLVRLGRLYETTLNDLDKAIAKYEEYIAVAKPPANDPVVVKLPVLKQMKMEGGMKPAPESEQGQEKKSETNEEGKPQ